MTSANAFDTQNRSVDVPADPYAGKPDFRKGCANSRAPGNQLRLAREPVRASSGDTHKHAAAAAPRSIFRGVAHMKHGMRKCLIVAASLAPLLALGQLAPATGLADPNDVSAASLLPSHRIEGMWDEQVVQVDCQSGAPLHPIGRGPNLFIRGGALVATNNAPPTVLGIALGEWRYVGGHGNKFRARMRLNLFQPPLETFLGFREITREITLANHGNRLSGLVSVQDYFPEGSPNGNAFCASEAGTRIPSP